MTGLAAPFLADSSRAGAFLEATPSACGRVAAKLEHGDGGAEPTPRPEAVCARRRR